MELMLAGANLKKKVVREVMTEALPVVGPNLRVDQIARQFSDRNPAVLVKQGRDYRIITKYDLLDAMAKTAGKL